MFLNEEDYYGPGLVRRREEAGLSRKDMASFANIPINTLRRYETGEQKPGLENLIKIENTLIRVKNFTNK